MQRFFITLAYHGASYCGWQIQPNAATVQETLEKALSTILRRPVGVTGCGRTDTGVHARYYVAHFDTDSELPASFLNGINSLLPPDIAVYEVWQVAADAHARFDAYERSYQYFLSFRKNPFQTETAWFYPQFRKLDFGKMQEVAALLGAYSDFLPFCKSDSGLDAFHCELKHAAWTPFEDGTGMRFDITANRFLRGMVRLIVGACVQCGSGQLTIDEVKTALDNQTPLKKSLSVPAHGLFLTEVKYPADPEKFGKGGAGLFLTGA